METDTDTDPDADAGTGTGTATVHCPDLEVLVDRIADFLFEVGMLKRTPRTGWQFLAGAESESVADHSFRVAMIAFALSRLEGVDVDSDRVLRLALVHDLAEARTGDLNYMNQKYVQADEERASADLVRGLPFAAEIAGLLAEYRDEVSEEAILTHDADQLELLLQLVEHRDAGVPATDHWVPFVLKRLRTDTGRRLAERIIEGNSANWWFDRDSDWWIRGGKG